MDFVVKTREFSQKKHDWMTITDETSDIIKVLDIIASEMNAPRVNGFIPTMYVSEDDDTIIIDIKQEMSAYMKRKNNVDD